MLTLSSPQVVQETVLRWKKEQRVAFVPTMGCLHEGHLSLIHLAKKYGQKIIVSIFVNPLQFGPKEDFAAYPRPIEDDMAKLDAAQADILFAPSTQDFYPPNFSSRVKVGPLAESLCGKSRPGHFEGVATVCLKLFQITQPDFAIFGEKDFQQLRVLQQLTADFNLPMAIVPHPIFRESDGLAMSSRNRYLSVEERQWARLIPEALREVQAWALSHPETTVGDLLQKVRDHWKETALIEDYVEIASGLDLTPSPTETKIQEIRSPRLFLAAHLGKTRLIDNGDLSKRGT